MHKSLYASGFLYHPPTEQILLQQSIKDPTASWSLFSGESQQEKTSQVIFKNFIEKMLKVKLSLKSIFPVYTSKDDSLVVYAEIGEMQQFPSSKTMLYAWFPRKKIAKINVDHQTKQDITIAFRVIDAHKRKLMEEDSL